LEDVVVATIDDRDVGFAMSQSLGRRNAGEAAAYDHDVRFTKFVRWS
jgi:hypothetical protein